MLNADISLVTNRFLDLWDGSMPIVYDVIPMTEKASSYARFRVILGGSAHLYGDTITGGKRQLGRVMLEVFVPDNLGDFDAYDALDRFIAIFRNWQTSVINCRTEDLTEPRPAGKGLMMYRASIPFETIRPYAA